MASGVTSSVVSTPDHSGLLFDGAKTPRFTQVVDTALADLTSVT
ncbi:hypothetical protein AWB66_04580 [Caballeronia telluris]|uniref:Uncharacterized protein n=1 Tax=Caballeronia telluris TaxID=326475 RepID=A0A158JR88_9BURK|nr:hypothetical protein AWB66_04477 [Caballeronia telluris]SAL71708.1 hypothetical protein AWB66_04580 [Caballeronia telluris]